MLNFLVLQFWCTLIHIENLHFLLLKVPSSHLYFLNSLKTTILVSTFINEKTIVRHRLQINNVNWEYWCQYWRTLDNFFLIFQQVVITGGGAQGAARRASTPSAFSLSTLSMTRYNSADMSIWKHTRQDHIFLSPSLTHKTQQHLNCLFPIFLYK